MSKNTSRKVKTKRGSTWLTAPIGEPHRYKGKSKPRNPELAREDRSAHVKVEARVKDQVKGRFFVHITPRPFATVSQLVQENLHRNEYRDWLQYDLWVVERGDGKMPFVKIGEVKATIQRPFLVHKGRR